MSDNIYNQFNKSLKTNLSNILKSTKDMIIDTKKFSCYSRNYYNFTQSVTFMKPEINEYPIIKNKKFIPLNKRIFSLSNENEKNKNGIKHLKKNFKKSLLLNDNSRPMTQRTYNSNFSKKTFSLTPKKNKIEQEELFILRNNIFNDETYSNLKYDESEIFHKEIYYSNFIENYINKLKENKTENLTTFVKRNFYENNYDLNDGKIISSLKFKSMKIEFINLTNSSKKKISFQIPFTFLPIFYSNNMKTLKYVLLSIFKFSEDFEEINFEEEELYNLIKYANQYQFHKRKRTEKIEKKEEEENIKKLIFKEKKTKIKIRDNKLHKIYSNKINFYSSKFENQYNYYNYIWVTPKYTFKLIIKTPNVIVKISNLTINKFIDLELFLFILKRNFLNWDFYIIHYLFSFKSFRYIIKTFLSKDKKKNYELKYNSDKHGYIRFQKLGNLIYIYLTKEKSLLLKNLNNHHFMFFSTNEEQKNYLKIFHSYSALISNDSVNQKKEFNFSFNFSQMIVLNKISKIQKLQDFINKLIYTQNSFIFLKYKFFDDYNNMCYIEKTPEEEIKKRNIESARKSSLTRNSFSQDPLIQKYKTIENTKFIINITNPFIETIEYLDRNNLFEGNCILSNDNNHRELFDKGLDEICLNDMVNWPKIILKYSIHDKSYLDKCRNLKNKFNKTTTVKNLNAKNAKISTSNLINALSIKSKKTLSYFSPRKTNYHNNIHNHLNINNIS